MVSLLDPGSSASGPDSRDQCIWHFVYSIFPPKIGNLGTAIADSLPYREGHQQNFVAKVHFGRFNIITGNEDDHE